MDASVQIDGNTILATLFDGTTILEGDLGVDDTEVLQAMLDVLPGSAYVHPGSYLIDQMLLIKSDSHLTLSPGATFTRAATAPISLMRNLNWNVAEIVDQNITIEGGIWDGAKATHPGGVSWYDEGLMLLKYARDSCIKNIHGKNALMYAPALWNCENSSIDGGTIVDSAGPALVGGYYNTIERIGSYRNSRGVFVGDGATSSKVSRCNIVQTSTGYTIFFEDPATDIVIESSKLVTETGATGCNHFMDSCLYITFDGNSFSGTKYVEINALSKVVMQNCQFLNAILNSGSDNSTIKGCTFNGTSAGILLTKRGLIESCNFIGNLKGLDIRDPNANGYVRDSNFVGCSDGIYSHYAINGFRMLGNYFETCGKGIRFNAQSQSTTVKDCIFKNNTYDILYPTRIEEITENFGSESFLGMTSNNRLKINSDMEMLLE